MLNPVIRLLMLMFAALACASPALAQSNHISARLVAESTVPAAGSTVTIALDMKPEKGWHGYWSNPGEAGFEPRLTWVLPKDVTIGAPAFPVPQTLLIADLMNYVFEAEYATLFRLRVPAGLAAGTRLPIRLKAEWLACTDEICVPERGTLTLDLMVGDGTATESARFDMWRARLPAPLGSPARFERASGRLRIAIPFPADAAIGAPHFFPATNGLIADAAPQSFSRAGDLLIADLAALPNSAAPASLGGVLAIGEGRGLEISAAPGAVPAEGQPLGAANDSAISWSTILLAIGGALLGGLILNVMPCVFPIISLKALSLAKAGDDERAARRDALAYAGGAVTVCVALGGAILALRAGGSSVGWAFQLQDPRVILVLLLLVTAIALNLAGLFELPSVGGGVVTQGNGFLTGALAAFVATPCTGPFMGAALGAALVLPAAAAIGVFAGLGVGLALPFLALGFVPALRRRLPRPGGWMATLQRILSVPMFVTAVALAWLLGRQAGSDAMSLGLGLVLAAAMALWWAGRRQAKGLSGLAFGAVAAVAVTVLGVAVLPSAAAPSAASKIDALKSEPFSEARLAALRGEGRPVFVYFTADWCLTCKVNERAAIGRAEVVAAFEKARVATLVGDWTRSDPVIGRFLNAHGRSGVPLYLYYRPGSAEPQVLPQILTPGALVALTVS